MKFFTKYSMKRDRKHCATGDGTEKQYKLYVDENGVRDLKVSGTIDSYGVIQSFKDSTDIHVLLSRYANGDESALNARQALYGDFTNMPQTMHELQQRIIDAEAMFTSLPLEVREKFNHDPSQFFVQMGTPQFNEWYNEFYGSKDNTEVVTTVSVDKEGVEVDG